MNDKQKAIPLSHVPVQISEEIYCLHFSIPRHKKIWRGSRKEIWSGTWKML